MTQKERKKGDLGVIPEEIVAIVFVAVDGVRRGDMEENEEEDDADEDEGIGEGKGRRWIDRSHPQPSQFESNL